MIDYVALIARRPTDPAFIALRQHLARTLEGWNRACALDQVDVFVRSRLDSKFSANVHQKGCQIGVGLEREDGGCSGYLDISLSDDRGVVTVERDPTGLIPCWRLSTRGGEFLFSSMDYVAKVAGIPLEIDWDFILYHLNAPHSRGRRTGISGVTELLPGWRLRISSDSIEEEVSWNPADITRSPFRSGNEARDALRTAAEKTVGAWGRRYGRIALTLSGGLDSAIVLGLLRRHAPDTEVIGVNFLVSHAEGDERSYAEAAARLHGIPLRIETISPDLTFDFNEGRGRLRPSNYVLPLGYRQVRERIVVEIGPQAIFSGTGGDHLFHQDVSTPAIADAILDRRPIREVVGVSHQLAGLAKETIWGVLHAGLRAATSRAPSISDIVGIENSFLADDAQSKIDWSLAHPDAVSVVDGVRPGKFRQIVSIHQLQGHYWRYGSAFGADEVHPLLSRKLLEASLRTPTYWFSRGGIRRGLARAAFADLLPEAISSRRGKGANTSHWVRVMTANLKFLRELLLDGELVRSGLVSQPMLESALAPLKLAAKADLPSLIACIGTEIWLQQTKAIVGNTSETSFKAA